MATPPEIASAARRAALQVEKMLVEMLTADQSGNVSVEVSVGGLTPIKRVERRAKTIKVFRGHNSPIERVEA